MRQTSCMKTALYMKHIGQRVPVAFSCPYVHYITIIMMITASHIHTAGFFYYFVDTLPASLPQNESSASFGSFKHQASDSLRLWSVWDWTRLCCWAQGGLARSDDLTHKLHSAGPRWCAALCVLHEVIRVGSCRAVCSILSCFTVRKCSVRTLSSVNSTL